ncbi:MAG: efflux RND transporter periplasmic adaptor subunit [Candidatus Cloacimonadaceae bacterium]|jgi:HlyD family secretion protein|nr:efflux RND transporter periplasmic adaptor subunit [Candidatus Cloacimonadota bacterium]MDY0127641.1 efflux RND transporter periplasmic adaptor subunit [Candidatus Cloacimonadaceae bacterium]MCB5254388.1 efflux RND transporter periplasmic adaptor subunit [Candidatus Cloacimonadota bacterium]MCK9178192.1 efflux RND transporter periplasmic adaptor subunit [Candidatus Cloacimonadota bacterium]MCK9241992.1 efflux RND transporter periplasmic adaptor subunit [Candidatus Cloacimonadota bacterium]
MRKKWIIIAIATILIVLVIGLSRCNRSKDQEAPATYEEHEKYTVKRGKIDSKIEVTGEVQPATIVSQKSRVSGKIVKFYVQENDYVEKGAILADIEPDYNQANTLFNTKASLQRAELALQQAQKDFADSGVLLESEYISQADYDAARDALSSAEIQYAQASRQYEMIRDLDVPGTVIHMIATASGTVIERKVNEGEMVTSTINAFGEGTVVMQIANLSHMIVQSNINEVDIAKFRVGQKGTIKLDALPYESYEGKIVKIAPKAITINNAKVFPVEISINATGATARPGMTAAISIQGESREDVIVIPIGAVFADDKNQDLVYVIPADTLQSEGKAGAQKPEARVVKLGANDFQRVEIIENLEEGEIILLKEPDLEMNMQFNFN